MEPNEKTVYILYIFVYNEPTSLLSRGEHHAEVSGHLDACFPVINFEPFDGFSWKSVRTPCHRKQLRRCTF